MTSKCNSCQAPIEWCKWDSTGRKIPIDAAPAANGNLVVIGGRVRTFQDVDAKERRPRRVAHFATCPDAAKWRNR